MPGKSVKSWSEGGLMLSIGSSVWGIQYECDRPTGILAVGMLDLPNSTAVCVLGELIAAMPESSPRIGCCRAGERFSDGLLARFMGTSLCRPQAGFDFGPAWFHGIESGRVGRPG